MSEDLFIPSEAQLRAKRKRTGLPTDALKKPNAAERARRRRRLKNKNLTVEERRILREAKAKAKVDSNRVRENLRRRETSEGLDDSSTIMDIPEETDGIRRDTL